MHVPSETHQLVMVLSLVVRAGIWEEQHLRVGVDTEVELHRLLVASQEVGHSLCLRFRLRKLSAVGLITRLVRGTFSCRGER